MLLKENVLMMCIDDVMYVDEDVKCLKKLCV